MSRKTGSSWNRNLIRKMMAEKVAGVPADQLAATLTEVMTLAYPMAYVLGELTEPAGRGTMMTSKLFPATIEGATQITRYDVKKQEWIEVPVPPSGEEHRLSETTYELEESITLYPPKDADAFRELELIATHSYETAAYISGGTIKVCDVQDYRDFVAALPTPPEAKP